MRVDRGGPLWVNGVHFRVHSAAAGSGRVRFLFSRSVTLPVTFRLQPARNRYNFTESPCASNLPPRRELGCHPPLQLATYGNARDRCRAV